MQLWDACILKFRQAYTSLIFLAHRTATVSDVMKYAALLGANCQSLYSIYGLLLGIFESNVLFVERFIEPEKEESSAYILDEP